MREIAIVINARVSSTRMPQKLIRPFAHTTLIDIALYKLSQIPVQQKYLAAGDEEIISIYNKYSDNINLLLRKPDAVAKGEHSHTVSFAHYADIPTEYILIMNPCMPFTKISTYMNAIDHFKSNSDIQTMTSIISDHNIYFNHNNEIINLIDKNHISTRNTHPIKRMAHIVHIINKQTFLDTGHFWAYQTNDPFFFEVDKDECFDIDDESDFKICETLYASGYNL